VCIYLIIFTVASPTVAPPLGVSAVARSASRILNIYIYINKYILNMCVYINIFTVASPTAAPPFCFSAVARSASRMATVYIYIYILIYIYTY